MLFPRIRLLSPLAGSGERPWSSLVVVILVLLAGCSRSDPEETAAVPAVNAGDAGHQAMLVLLEDIRMRTPDENIWLGDADARALRARIADLGPGTPAVEVADLSFRLGLAELRLGNEAKGIEYLLEAYRRLPEIKHQLTPDRYDEMIFQLGVAYLRLGETRNCCLHRTAESCILPIRGGGVHTDVEGSESAVRYFTEVLRNTPPDSPMHLRALWLLNITHMTIGTYPDEIPVAYRIPPDAFRSDQPFAGFVETAHGAGVDTSSLSGGAIVDDFDGDGYLDLIVSTWDTSGQIRVFRNGGDGTFVNRTRESGLVGIFGGLNLVQADYDNDGDPTFWCCAERGSVPTAGTRTLSCAITATSPSPT